MLKSLESESSNLWLVVYFLTAIVVTLVAASILFFLGEASAKPIEEMPCDGCGNGGFP